MKKKEDDLRLANRYTATVSALALLGALGAAAPAAAQDETFESDPVFDRIIVTSKKREQSIYEAAVAVTALTNDDLEKRQIIDLVDVGKFVPNLNVTTFSAGNTSSANPFIRGIGIQDHLIVTDPGVGVYIDGVYLGRQVGQNWSLSNIERLEVLRGPQGTLFGRNTIGGAINIITQRPGDDEVARFSATVGSRGRFNGDFYGNTRISDDLAVSANIAIKRRDGVGEYVLQDNPEARVGELLDISGRIAARWTPTDRLSIQIAADGNDAKNGQNPYRTIVAISPDCAVTELLLNCVGGFDGSEQSADPYDSNSGQTDLAQTTNSAYGINATVDYEINANLAAKLIASYRYSEYEGGLDDDGGFVDFYSFPEVGNAKQYTVEAQINGEYDRFDFVGGFFYFFEEGSNIQDPVTFIGPGGFFQQSQETTSYAIYVNGGYQVLDALRIAGGVRYTWDEKTAFADLGFLLLGDVSDDWEQVTWEASATYELRDDLSVYALVSRGYQSGGFPARPYPPVSWESFDPVTATNYEGGIKGIPFDWQQIALSVFYTEYTDLPVQISFLTDDGFVTLSENVGESRSVGVEVEGRTSFGELTDGRLDGLYLNTAIGFIDAEFTETGGSPSVQEGNTPALTPRWTLAIGPEYTMPFHDGDISFRADYSYRADMEGQPNNSAITLIESRNLVNFDITYTSGDGTWSAGVYGKNIFDERYDNARLDVGDYTLVILSNDASEFGGRITKSF